MWFLNKKIKHLSQCAATPRGANPIGKDIESFNRDAHVVKVTSVKFIVNCLVVYGKSPWKV